MRATRVTAAAALPLVLTSAGLVSAQPAAAAQTPRAAQLVEAVVNRVDDSSTGQSTGDNLFVLTNLDPQATENTPANTTAADCANEVASIVPVAATATYSNGTQQTKTISPGNSALFQLNSKSKLCDLIIDAQGGPALTAVRRVPLCP